MDQVTTNMCNSQYNIIFHKDASVNRLNMFSPILKIAAPFRGNLANNQTRTQLSRQAGQLNGINGYKL